MNKHRQAAKIDSNQPEIVKVLRAIPGISVSLNHDDILVGYLNNTYWFEVKEPSKVSKRTNTVIDSAIKPSQKKLLEEWKGHYSIVWSVDQILNEIGI